MGRRRDVFFSDSAAPIITRIVKKEGARILELLEKLREDKDVKRETENKHILRRFEALIDLTSRDED